MAFILGVSGRPYAEATRARIDTEVARLPREIEQRALDLFTTHRCVLDQLAELLLEQETVDGSVVYRLIEAATRDHRCDGPATAPTAGSAVPAVEH